MSEIDFFAEIAEPLADGSWINSNIARIVEIIQDYDPNLEVRWLPRDQRAQGNDVFQIIEHCKDGADRVAFTVKDEASFDERVLNKIFEADMTKDKQRGLTIQEKIEIANNTQKIIAAKKWQDKLEERQELAQSILKSPLNAYSHNGIRYDLPDEAQPKKAIVHQSTIRSNSTKRIKFKAEEN